MREELFEREEIGAMLLEHFEDAVVESPGRGSSSRSEAGLLRTTRRLRPIAFRCQLTRMTPYPVRFRPGSMPGSGRYESIAPAAQLPAAQLPAAQLPAAQSVRPRRNS